MKIFKQGWQNNCWTAEACCNINFMDDCSAAAGEVINQLLPMLLFPCFIYLNEQTGLWWSVYVRLSCRFPPSPPSAGSLHSLWWCICISENEEGVVNRWWRQSGDHSCISGKLGGQADAAVQGVVAAVNSHWLMTFFDCFCATARNLWPGTNYTLTF